MTYIVHCAYCGGTSDLSMYSQRNEHKQMTGWLFVCDACKLDGVKDKKIMEIRTEIVVNIEDVDLQKQSTAADVPEAVLNVEDIEPVKSVEFTKLPKNPNSSERGIKKTVERQILENALQMAQESLDPENYDNFEKVLEVLAITRSIAFSRNEHGTLVF